MSPRRAFSLIEVVVALGIFAIAIVGILGLLSPTTQAVADTLDGGTASRLAEALNSEVERLGYSNIVPSKLVLGSDLASLPTDDSSLLFANRTGELISGHATQPTASNYIAPSARFFEIVLARNGTLSPVINDDTAGFVAFSVQVSWPAFVDDEAGGAVAVARNKRSSFGFNAAVRR